MFKLSSRRYTGAKTKLLSKIEQIALLHLKSFSKKQNLSFFDVFAGTGVVSEAFMRDSSFSRFIINDFLHSNFVLYYAFFKQEGFDALKLEQIALKYQSLKPANLELNYYAKHFGGSFFSHNDALLIGFIRQDLTRLLSRGELSKKEFYILLASLIYSSDRIANTVGHYDAYRKNAPLQDSFCFELISPLFSKASIEIYQEDANILAKKLAKNFSQESLDIAFIDPPYNSRQYSRFYHLLETLTQDTKPDLSGVAKKPKPENISLYCKNQASEAFSDLINSLSAYTKMLIITYNNTYSSKSSSSQNKISLKQILQILQNKGKTTLYELPFKAFNSGKTDFKEHKELIFVCEMNI